MPSTSSWTATNAENAGNVTFSEPHGATAADVDGDGILDFIVGKRAFAHNESYVDPNPPAQPVLYWYRTFRNSKVLDGVEFVPELVHNRSGAGSAIGTAGSEQDGAIDILTSTNRGTFVFLANKSKTVREIAVYVCGNREPGTGNRWDEDFMALIRFLQVAEPEVDLKRVYDAIVIGSVPPAAWRRTC